MAIDKDTSKTLSESQSQTETELEQQLRQAQEAASHTAQTTATSQTSQQTSIEKAIAEQKALQEQQSRSVVEVPDWVKAAGKETYDHYVALASQANQQAGGGLTNADLAAGKTFVAPQSALTAKGIGDVGANAFSFEGALDGATGLLDPSNFNREINAGTGMNRTVGPDGKVHFDQEGFSPVNMEKFQNPYLRMVMDQGLSDIDRENSIAMDRAGDAAAKASAFGGARHGVYQAELARNAMEKRNAFEIAARSGSYDKAIQARNAERDAALRGISLEDSNRLAGANALTGLAEKTQQLGLTGAGAEIGAGDIDQAQTQRELDAAAAARKEGIYTPLATEASQMNVLGQVPYDKVATSEGTTESTGSSVNTNTGQVSGTVNGLSNTVGDTSASSTLDSSGSSSGMTDTSGESKTKGVTHDTLQPPPETDLTGQLIGAGASVLGAALPKLLSSPQAKEGMEPVKGSDEGALNAFSQMPVKKFRYKDGLGMPRDKRMGPMAPEFANAFGGDGSTIDIGKHLGALTQAVKALDKRTRARR